MELSRKLITAFSLCTTTLQINFNSVLGALQMASAFAKKYFQCISILASVLFILYRKALVV